LYDAALEKGLKKNFTDGSVRAEGRDNWRKPDFSSEAAAIAGFIAKDGDLRHYQQREGKKAATGEAALEQALQT
jgi:hypothetical protein